MASNAKNLAELLNTDTTVAVADVADGSITTAKLADDAVTSAKIGAGAVGTTEIADDAVTSAKSDGTVGIGKNVIINGGMTVAQRNTSVTGIGASSGYFTTDRWKIDVNNSGGRFTMAQDSSDTPDTAGFANCTKLSCTTADTSIAADEYFIFQQRIEGFNLQQFAKGTSSAKAFAVSFYVKGNASATYTAELYDNDNSRQLSKTFNVTTSWNRVSLLYAADTTGAFGMDSNNSLNLNIWIHAGSNFTSGTLNSSSWASSTTANRVSSSNTSFVDSTSRTFSITGVKLEPVQVTDFEHEDVETALRKCQRYYQTGSYRARPFGDDTGSGYCQGWSPVEFRTNMRANPSVTISGESQLGFQVKTDGFTAYTWFANSGNEHFDCAFSYIADSEL